MAERRSHLILMGLIVAALIGVALLALPGSPLQKTPTLGLDLQGGLEVVKKAVPEKGQDGRRGRSRRRGRRSCNAASTAPASPSRRSASRAATRSSSSCPGVDDQQRAAELIGKTAKLELYDLQGDLVPGVSLDLQGFPVAHDSVFDLLSTQQTEAKKGEPSAFYLVKTPNKKKKIAPQTARRSDADPRDAPLVEVREEQRQEGRGAQGHHGAGRARAHGRHHLQPDRAVLRGRARMRRTAPTTTSSSTTRTNEEHPVPEMTGSDLKRTGTRQDFDTQTNQPVVLMQFTGGGGEEVRGHHADARRARQEPGQPAGARPAAPPTTTRISSSRSSSTAR